MNDIQKLFSSSTLDDDRIKHIDALPEPRSRFLIAITPRSGSSYLCDLMTKIKLFGTPGEMLNQQFIPEIVKKYSRTYRLRNTFATSFGPARLKMEFPD